MKARTLYFAQLVLLGSSLSACGKEEPDSPRDESSTDPIDDCRVLGECEVAAPLDRTVATTVSEAAEFLYTGDDPLQRDVEEGSIDRARVALIRGRVEDAAGKPVLGAKVSVVGHPEWGWTYSRKDGFYDLAVNGGGRLVINFAFEGHLGAGRAVQPGWLRYETIPTVALAQKSDKVTGVSTNAKNLQVAEGERIDAGRSNKHQPLVLFAPGTEATAHLPDGDKKALNDLSVRVSEYPFSASNKSSDEAEFSAGTPSTTGLSYSLGFSVDEAEELGAKSVSFTKPVTLYVENLMDLETGSEVPFGYYSPESGNWEQEKPLLAVEILSEDGGEAQLDADGDGKVDSADELKDLAFSADELKLLAKRYEPGQSLWRARVEHFSQYQGDLPIVPPPTAFAPSVSTPKMRPLATTTRRGMARVESQAVTQTLPIAGTPYSLYYQSDRTASFGAAFEIEVPLIGEEIPQGLVEVQVSVSIAGQQMQEVFEPAENLSHTFQWDGRDGEERLVQGQQRAKIEVRYRYPGEVRVTKRNHSGWGTVKSESEAIDSGVFSTLSQTFEIPVGTWDAGGYEMGGFGLDVLHAYDPAHHTLHFGNGDAKYAENIALVVDRPALGEDLGKPDSIVIAPDGSAIFTDDENDRILRISPDDEVTVLVGKGAKGPAADLELRSPQGVALKSNGSLVVADYVAHKIWEIDPGGNAKLLVGPKGEGAQATSSLKAFEGIALGPSEEIYVVSSPSVYRLRGKSLTLFAGGGESEKEAPGKDGGPATEAFLNVPTGVVAAPDGTVYISERDGDRIRKVTPNGTIFTYAGTGEAGFSGDGELAINAQIQQPRGLALSSDGTLYFSDRTNNRIRFVTPDGRIQTLAGGGDQELVEDDGKSITKQSSQLATDVSIELPDGLAMGRDGAIWVSAATGLYRVRPGTPEFESGENLVPSQDGKTLYRFDARGKHLETIDAMTGVVELTFTYDKQGFLTLIKDRNNLPTTFDRDNSGKLTKVTGPFGQETLVDIDGFELAQLTDPLGREKNFTYEDGLLTLTEDAEGEQYEFEYDKQGRLLSVSDPTGYKESFKRKSVPGGYSVGVTTAAGKSMSFVTKSLPGGTLERSIIDYNGEPRVMEDRIMTQTLRGADGSRYFTALSPDPAFGPQSTYTAISETSTPGGRTLAVYPLRTKQVSDAKNALSIEEWSDLVDVNGRFYETKYNRAQQTLTTITPMGREQEVVFDDFGNPIESKTAGFAKRTWSYDKSGRPTEHREGSDRVQQQTYSDFGFPETLANALGQETVYTQDIMGRALSTEFADGSLLSLAWDNRDNVTGFTPPGKQLHGFAYNEVDMLEASQPPSVKGAAQDLGHVNYQYGKDHELTKMSFSDGREIAFRYDGAKRLDRTTIGDVRLSYSYDAANRVKAVNRSDSVKVARNFDGPLWTGDAWTGAITGEVSADYDDNFWLTSLTVNNSSTAHFTHDDDGLVTSCRIRDFALDVSRDKKTGLVTGTELDGVSTEQGFNEFGELENLSVNGESDLFSQSIERDALGRVTSITEVVDGNESQVSYSYDLIGQLSEVNRDGVITKYSYDSNGNRINVETEDAVIKSKVDAQDRIETYGSWEFTHTETGDLQRRTNEDFSIDLQYDELGNLLSVVRATNEGYEEKIDYKVDGMGRRISRAFNGKFERAWLYQDDLRPVYEVKADGTSSHFVYADQGQGGAPEFMVQDGVAYRFVKDHVGSVRLVVDAETGAIVQQLEYDAFGTVLTDSNPGFQPFGFAGGLYDWNTDLVRFGARDYDAGVGRWTAKDLIGFAGLQANVYVYVGNDPVNFVDPTGKWGFSLGLSGGGGGGEGVFAWLFGPAADIAGGIVVDYTNGHLTVANYYSGTLTVGVGGYAAVGLEGGVHYGTIDQFAGAAVVAKGESTALPGTIGGVGVGSGGTIGTGFFGFGGGAFIGVGLTDTGVSGFRLMNFLDPANWDVLPFSRDPRWLP